MSNLPISSKYRSRPHDPVEDSERESVLARVNQAFEQGVLDDSRYRWALDATFAATTLGELLPVVEQLPVQATHNVPAIVSDGSVGGRPGELSEAHQPGNRTVMMVVGGVAAAIFVLIVLLVILL